MATVRECMEAAYLNPFDNRVHICPGTDCGKLILPTQLVVWTNGAKNARRFWHRECLVDAKKKPMYDAPANPKIRGMWTDGKGKQHDLLVCTCSQCGEKQVHLQSILKNKTEELMARLNKLQRNQNA